MNSPDSTNDDPKTTARTEVVTPLSLPADALPIVAAVQSIFENIGESMKAQAVEQAKAQIAQAEHLAKTQMHAEEQATERARIASAFLKPFFWCAFGLYGITTVMALTALLKGQVELAEKIIIALFASLFSLLAGIGISRKS